MEHILLRRGEKVRDGDEFLWIDHWQSIPPEHGQYEITKDYSEYVYPKWKPPGHVEYTALSGKPLPSELLLVLHYEGLGGTTLSELPHRRKLAIPYGEGDPRVPQDGTGIRRMDSKAWPNKIKQQGGNFGKSEALADYVKAGSPKDAAVSTKLGLMEDAELAVKSASANSATEPE